MWWVEVGGREPKMVFRSWMIDMTRTFGLFGYFGSNGVKLFVLGLESFWFSYYLYRSLFKNNLNAGFICSMGSV
jgi:hypothetical protein